jgi:hypothetical protein
MNARKKRRKMHKFFCDFCVNFFAPFALKSSFGYKMRLAPGTIKAFPTHREAFNNHSKKFLS